MRLLRRPSPYFGDPFESVTYGDNTFKPLKTKAKMPRRVDSLAQSQLRKERSFLASIFRITSHTCPK